MECRGKKNISWKEGPDSIWSLCISSKEVCKQLKKRGRLVERELSKENSKRLKLENNVQDLKREVSSLRKVNESSTKTMNRLKRGLKENTRDGSSKPWQSYSKKHQTRKKRRLVSDIKEALSSCSEHFKPVSVDIENTSTGERQQLDITRGSHQLLQVKTRQSLPSM